MDADVPQRASLDRPILKTELNPDGIMPRVPAGADRGGLSFFRSPELVVDSGV